MTNTAKKPLTLGDLVRVNAELTIKWDLELPQNTDVYRGITPDYAEEIDFERAKTYLLKQDHPSDLVESALRPYFENKEKSIVIANKYGLNFDESLTILKKQKTLFNEIEEKKLKEKQKKGIANYLYRGIKRTSNFLLDNLKGTGIELKFKSLIDNDQNKIEKDVADVVIRGWKYFVAVYVTIPNCNGYRMGFAPWYVKIKDFEMGKASPLYPFNEDRGSWLLPGFAERTSKQRIDPKFIYACFDSPYYSKIFNHLVQLESDAFSAIIKLGIEAEREREWLEAEAASSLTKLLSSKENIEGKVDKL